MKMTPKHPPNRRLNPAILVMSAILVVLTGCAKSKPLKLSYEGTPDLNGGYTCLVRVYQLKTDANFMSAPRDTFWSNAPATFEADLAAPLIEVMLEPGQMKNDLKIKITKETKFIGAAADFRRPDKDAWRKILPFSTKKGLLPTPLRKSKEITLTISAGGIDIKS